jgi:hypothetical protein
MGDLRLVLACGFGKMGGSIMNAIAMLGPETALIILVVLAVPIGGCLLLYFIVRATVWAVMKKP